MNSLRTQVEDQSSNGVRVLVRGAIGILARMFHVGKLLRALGPWQ